MLKGVLDESLGKSHHALLDGEEMTLSPAEYVVSVFGGVRATARAIGRSPSSVSKWQKTTEERGSGGHIPSRAQRLILEYARKKNLDITAEDLMVGRKVTSRK